jgi:outer membrane protein assembly factor BamB
MLNFNTGVGILSAQSGGYLVHSNNEVAKLDNVGEIIWSIDLSDELTEYQAVSISEIQQLESGEYAVSTSVIDNSDSVVLLLLISKNGNLQNKSRLFSGNDIMGLSMQSHANGFTIAITQMSENSDKRLMVIEAGPDGELLKEQSYTFGLNDYNLSGEVLVLSEREGFLVDMILDSSNDDNSTSRRLVKLDKDLNQLWSLDYGSMEFNEVHDIFQLSSGDFLLAGTTQFEGWVLKISKSGLLEWDKKFGPDRPGKISLFDIDEIEPGRTIYVGSNNSTGEGADDLWLLSLNERGQKLWETTHGSPLFDFGRSLIMSPERAIVVVGGSQMISSGPFHMYVLKLNSDGKL